MIDFIRSRTARLTTSYLAIIMSLSIGFSIVLYHTSANELGRQLPPRSFFIQQLLQPDQFNSFFTQRISQARHHLLGRLVLLNIFVLAVSAALSYFLARRTLQPIEEAMEAQSRFSSDASHELRTPLTAIRTRNEVALRKPRLSLLDAKDIIKSNIAEVIKLERLSEGLLRLSSNDVQDIAKKPVWLGEIAGDAMNQVVEGAQAKKIKLEEKLPKIKVLADSDSLTQAVVILLDNAIKYSPQRSTIHLEGHTKGGDGYLNVRDEGVGIAATDLPHIFDRFYRVDNSRSRSGADGYGLGLAIAKQIIEHHGGEIIVQSTPDHGSTFSIKLSLADS